MLPGTNKMLDMKSRSVRISVGGKTNIQMKEKTKSTMKDATEK
jgi:hypothetical protein